MKQTRQLPSGGAQFWQFGWKFVDEGSPMKGLNTQLIMVSVLSISALAMSGCRMDEPKFKPGYSDAEKIDADKLKKEKVAEKAEADKKAAEEKAAADKRAAEAEEAAKKGEAGATGETAQAGDNSKDEGTAAEQGGGQGVPEAGKTEADKKDASDSKEGELAAKDLMIKLESSNNQSRQVKVACQHTSLLGTVSDAGKTGSDILFLEGSSALIASATVMNEDKIEKYNCFETDASAQATRIDRKSVV